MPSPLSTAIVLVTPAMSPFSFGIFFAASRLLRSGCGGLIGEGLRAIAPHAVNDRKQVAVGNLFGGVSLRRCQSVAIRELFVGDGVAEFIEARAQSIAAGMFSQDQAARRNSHLFRNDNFVGQRIFQDAVLVNSGFMGEGISTDDRFIRRDANASDRAEHPAGGINFLERDIGGGGVMSLPHVQRHDNFFQRRISGALADAVDGAFDLAGAGGYRGQRIGDREAKIVVAMRAQHYLRMARQCAARGSENLAIFLGRGVADGVREVDDIRASFGGGSNDFDQEVAIGAAGGFRGKLHVFAVLAAVKNNSKDIVEGFGARYAQLVLQMQIGSGEKNVQARLGGRFERAERSIHVILTGASQGGDAATSNFGGDGAHGIEVTRRSNGKASFEDVDTQRFQLARQLQLFRAMHGESRRLLAVTQRRVENMNLIQAGSLGPSQYLAVTARRSNL